MKLEYTLECAEGMMIKENHVMFTFGTLVVFIDAVLEGDNYNAIPSYYPSVPNTFDKYISDQNWGKSPEEAVDKLIFAWNTHIGNTPRDKIRWIENPSYYSRNE